MTDQDINKVMPLLYNACKKYFYFTSTPHASANPAFDIEWGHINLKQKDEWIALFKKHGFKFYCDEKSVIEWGMIFKK
jgi:hypothetical protein